MADLVIKPQVAAFVNMVTASRASGLSFEQIEIPQGWAESGHAIRDLHVRRRTGASIIALQKTTGEFDTRPDGNTVLEAGDVIVGVGTADEIAALERMFAPREAVAR
jgi:voltage-gated potassium channel